jgi:hypothetical protein
VPGTLGPSYHLIEQPSAHVPLPPPVSVTVYTRTCAHTHTHTHTFPKQEAALCQKRMEFRFPEGVLGLQLHGGLTKKGPSVCAGGWESGASISVHGSLGPKKNPQLAVLSLATPSLSHIPSLPELSPHWVAPANQLSPPFPPVGRPSPGPHGTAMRGSHPRPKAAGMHRVVTPPPPLHKLLSQPPLPREKVTLTPCPASDTDLPHLPCLFLGSPSSYPTFTLLTITFLGLGMKGLLGELPQPFSTTRTIASSPAQPRPFQP